MSSNTIENNRILSLDVFRGLTMALMVLVNSLGTRVSYPILTHADWIGCNLADLVFPAFLFIVGITTVISLKRHINSESKAQLYRSILTRTLLLIVIGIFLSVFPKKIDFATMRFYGILQRIAVCYFICSMLYLHTSVRTQVLIFLSILIGYWFLLTQIPFPGSGADQLSMASNWVAYVDSQLFSPGHLFFKNYDPEGFLSTIPAIATTLSGLLTGHFLLTKISKQKKSVILISVGLIFLFLAWIWSYDFPIIKNIWTSTFVLWSSGFSLIVFGLCFFVIDVLGYTKWSTPFKIFGMNALFIFIFHVILLKIQSMFIFPLPNGTSDVLRVAISEYLFGGFSPENAGLFYAILFLFLNFLVAAFLYRRKIFIKI
ncbi:Putative heparan-alpha-glucosaminide N-acetyltransferase [Legionella steigerwaltii]|uniref:Heparan-alpha-glucosaminide N-acetyltransferase n=1 Tax=Legionella steigerwaltii TaxID=460 RepID=A0A378LBA7_9GAMM|nr:heparan-alpha-glucosaminide N-acetyltransferase domain-containing protein [Legionella steigerwaltii]KTD77699.1 putative Heparan-alpha-glucosaminide N-acetyltransferase [Legionella steigerwaltii]STY23009.1 Putative heparan-alpha-glucosaminide N-acetyltransferase [Legionella steigerwaltii]